MAIPTTLDKIVNDYIQNNPGDFVTVTASYNNGTQSYQDPNSFVTLTADNNSSGTDDNYMQYVDAITNGSTDTPTTPDTGNNNGMLIGIAALLAVVFLFK